MLILQLQTAPPELLLETGTIRLAGRSVRSRSTTKSGRKRGKRRCVNALRSDRTSSSWLQHTAY